MSAATSTADGIRKILVSQIYVEIPAAQMHEDASMRDVFGVDSLGFLELKDGVEDEFEISIPEDDFTVENFSTIRRLATLVDDQLRGERPASSPALSDSAT